MTEIKLTLLTVRTVEQGVFMEGKGKYSREYLIALHTIYLNPADAAKIQVSPGDLVNVKSSITGQEITCIAKVDPHVREGTAYMAYGFPANKLIGSETQGTGVPDYKNVPVLVTKSAKSREEFENYIESLINTVLKIPGVGDREVSPGEVATLKDVVCPFCGLLCDNLSVRVSGTVIVDVYEACVIGRSKFLNYHRDRVLKPLRRRENGEFIEISLERALDEAANLIASSKYPVFYGWSCTTCETIREALRLAELVGAVIDNTSSVCHGPTMMAVAETGHSDFTLGFTIHYADTVMFWAWNPAHAHPNFMYRFIQREGRASRGRRSKKIIVVDCRDVAPVRAVRVDSSRCVGCDLCVEYCPEIIKKHPRAPSRLVPQKYVIERELCRECEYCARICPAGAIEVEYDRDLLLQVEPGRDYDLLTALRVLLRGLEVEKSKIAGRVPREKVEELVNALERSRYVILFFGVGLTHSHGKFKNIEEAIKFTHDLNEHTKAIIIAMRGHFNVTGTNMVFLWTYGAPFGIDLSRRYPRYIPGVTTTVDILRRGETDLMLVAGADPASSFPADAASHMSKIPVILLTPKTCKTLEYADIVIPVGLTGVEVEGTAYRLDAIPIRLRKIVPPPPGVRSDEEIVRELYTRVEKLLRK